MDNGEKRTGAGIGSAGGTRVSERELIEYLHEHYPDMDHLPAETTYGLAMRALKRSLPPYLLADVIEGCEAVSYWIAAERPQATQPEIDRILDTLSDIARRLSALGERRQDAGLSWAGNQVYGDRKSIQTVHDAIHKASQVPYFLRLIERSYPNGLQYLRRAGVSMETDAANGTFNMVLAFKSHEELIEGVDEFANTILTVMAAARGDV